MPLSADDIEKGRLEQFPTAMGAIVLTVNVPGIEDKQLNPTGPLVAALFMGKVSRWNDRRIAELNPGVNLPNLPVAPVYRADASGTTFQFTDYLAKVSEEWKSRVAQGRPLAGLRGSAPTATMVSPVPCATRRAIGYVEYAYAKLNRLVSTQLQNREGNFVVPSKALFQAAVDNADWSSAPHFGISLNDQPGKDSWPIIAPTFILVPLDAADPQRTRNVLRVFEWAFRNGDSITEELVFITLPDSTKNTIRQMWAAKFNFRSE